MVDAAVLLLVFLLPFVIVVLLVAILVAVRHRPDPAPAAGWPQPPAVMQMTMIQGPVCGCGGELRTVTYDTTSGQPSTLRCQSCGREGVVGPWLAMRERLP